MIMIDQLTDQQFELQALELIKQEFGADGLARFLRLNRSGAGDYTRERTGWLQGVTVDQILESIQANRGSGSNAETKP